MGGGKSTVVTALLEQMMAHDLQFCVVDPEGDYAEFPAVVVGDAKHEPSVSEIMGLLAMGMITCVNGKSWLRMLRRRQRRQQSVSGALEQVATLATVVP